MFVYMKHITDMSDGLSWYSTVHATSIMLSMATQTGEQVIIQDQLLILQFCLGYQSRWVFRHISDHCVNWRSQVQSRCVTHAATKPLSLGGLPQLDCHAGNVRLQCVNFTGCGIRQLAACPRAAQLGCQAGTLRVTSDGGHSNDRLITCSHRGIIFSVAQHQQARAAEATIISTCTTLSVSQAHLLTL